MLKRRTHNKSRRGCQSCKKRHIKCDEKQPQCINCTVRGIACIYQLPLAVNSQVKQSKSRKDSTDAQAQPHDRDDSLRRQSLNVASSPVSVTAFSSSGESNRLLELELMHQWSTRTWQGVTSVHGDREYLQFHLPRASLSDSYLLNILLATAASDLACQSRRTDEQRGCLYHRAAFQYWQRAIEGFRLQLKGRIVEEKVSLIYHFAVIEAICTFSMPRGSSTFDRLNALFAMIVNTYAFVATNTPYLPICIQQVIEDFNPKTVHAVEHETKDMLDRLTSISCLVNVKTMDQGSESETALACDVEMYHVAIAHVKHCFADDTVGNARASFYSIVTALSPEFFQALKDLEPMALFILLFYGVLLHRLSKDETMWWAVSAGRSLVEEVLEMLRGSPLMKIPDVLAVISWARREAGISVPG